MIQFSIQKKNKKHCLKQFTLLYFYSKAFFLSIMTPSLPPPNHQTTNHPLDLNGGIFSRATRALHLALCLCVCVSLCCVECGDPFEIQILYRWCTLVRALSDHDKTVQSQIVYTQLWPQHSHYECSILEWGVSKYSWIVKSGCEYSLTTKNPS